MIESPRGRPPDSDADGSSGGSGSSALIPNAKHSNEKARFRPPAVDVTSVGTVLSSANSSPTAYRQLQFVSMHSTLTVQVDR